jgi:hypothetical protein
MSAIDVNVAHRVELNQVSAPQFDEPAPNALDGEMDYLNRQRQLLLDDLDTQIKQRKSYATAVFKLLCIWLATMFVILLLQGFKCFDFSLTDNVLLALIGGTTANVFGLFLVVMNYLFPKK